uniref:Uncharacterized protein n=1 Tax=Anguilla anguilla TaxID=7936 RepID=A0A0E9W9F3_ANGAN
MVVFLAEVQGQFPTWFCVSLKVFMKTFKLTQNQVGNCPCTSAKNTTMPNLTAEITTSI